MRRGWVGACACPQLWNCSSACSGCAQGLTQTIPQGPRSLGPHLPPAAPNGSPSCGRKLGGGLGAGIRDAWFSGTLHPGCSWGWPRVLLFLVLPVIFFSSWHIYFLAPCLYLCELCLRVWGKKEKHIEWVALGLKVSPWKRE